MKSTYTGPGFTIDVESEVRTETSGGHHIPNMKWCHVDEHGHTHRFDESGDLPTLEWVVTSTYWCDSCNDEHEEGERRCRECGDVVEPRWDFKGPYVFQVQGLTSYTVTFEDGRVFALNEADLSAFFGVPAGEQEAEIHKIVASKEPLSWRPIGSKEIA